MAPGVCPKIASSDALNAIVIDTNSPCLRHSPQQIAADAASINLKGLIPSQLHPFAFQIAPSGGFANARITAATESAKAQASASRRRQNTAMPSRIGLRNTAKMGTS